ncbi:MAG: DUF3817 domain-containing protein [Verrucomicrobiales bacterium]|nr:DUF3817 domain-containing protein [Verrucomicrobiales bacterium]
MSNPTANKIRIAVLTEGVSFLILLFIAMPLKYFADMPLAVKWVGWAHGALFVILCVLLLFGLISKSIDFKRSVLIFVCSLIPFGPFVINHKLKGN